MAYRKIVCGVTGSKNSVKAALEAARLADAFDAELIFVYAVDASFLKGMTVQVTSQYAEKTLEHLGHHILDRAREMARGIGVNPKLVLKKGPVLEVIKEVLVEEKADLLVIGHEKRSFFEKVLFKGKVEDHVQELKKQTGALVAVVK